MKRNKILKSLVFDLKKTILKKGKATLVVSGGSTPVQLFKQLSKTDLPWEKVTITLSDERCVNPKSKDSNENLVRKYLLKYYAKKAKFIPFYLPQFYTAHNMNKTSKSLKEIYPFDIIVLGMGEDGHTASLFPNNRKLLEAFDSKNKNIIIDIFPITAPYKRISLTKKAILDTKNIYLFMIGDKKRSVYNHLITQDNHMQYPVLSILQSEKPVKVFN